MSIDLNDVLKKWENQQNALVEKREERFRFIIDVIKNAYNGDIKILDLGCGPGSLAFRISDSIKNSQITAIDYDPVLLKIARSQNIRGKIDFIRGNLMERNWLEYIKSKKFNAVVSTTALHWIPEDQLSSLYKYIYDILNKNGIFMDGDHFYSEEDAILNPTFQKMKNSIIKQNIQNTGAMDWNQWWEYIEETGYFRPELEERNRIYGKGDHDQHISMEKHMKFLKNAGFSYVRTPWRYLDNRVLIASKQ